VKRTVPRACLIALLLVCPAWSQSRGRSGVDRFPPAPVFREPGSVIRLFSPNIWIDFNPKGRRVILRAEVCLREGMLEEFLCLRRTKEHESVVSADISAIMFHAALLAAGANPGHPAQFDPDNEFKPPEGQKLKIEVEWKEGNTYKRISAKQWVRHVDSKKPMQADWVFAGSQWVVNPVTKQKYYLGNDGDIISVANFAGSIVDVAMKSSSSNESLVFEANTEAIPPLGTEVFVIITPVKSKKKPARKSTSDNCRQYGRGTVTVRFDNRRVHGS